jgi:murein DD-endopeptidase MepM/ murein hydrolase activator NlpD
MLTSPMPDIDIRKARINKTLHGRSVYRPEDVPGHNVIKGYSTPGVGDALDIFASAGTVVRAMHDGRITRIADKHGKLACVYIQGARWLTIYAHLHIRECLRLGDYISCGTCIGWVGRQLEDPHLHLEIWERRADGTWIAWSARTPREYKRKLLEAIRC